MQTTLIQNGIVVGKSDVHGYGVFAKKRFKKNDIVEECCIFFTEGKEPGLANYYFKVEDQSAFLSGQGSLYNHSTQPNVNYYFDHERNLAIFKANCEINPGDELFISYGDTWFSERGMQIKQIPHWKKWLYPKYSLFLRAGLAWGAILLLSKLLVIFAPR